MMAPCGYCQRSVLVDPKVRPDDPLYSQHTRYWKVLLPNKVNIIPFCDADCSLRYELQNEGE